MNPGAVNEETLYVSPSPHTFVLGVGYFQGTPPAPPTVVFDRCGLVVPEERCFLCGLSGVSDVGRLWEERVADLLQTLSRLYTKARNPAAQHLVIYGAAVGPFYVLLGMEIRRRGMFSRVTFLDCSSVREWPTFSLPDSFTAEGSGTSGPLCVESNVRDGAGTAHFYVSVGGTRRIPLKEKSHVVSVSSGSAYVDLDQQRLDACAGDVYRGYLRLRAMCEATPCATIVLGVAVPAPLSLVCGILVQELFPGVSICAQQVRGAQDVSVVKLA
jgi:hypothetical protein